MKPLRFDPETHTYTANGVEVPSVTRIIAPITGFAGAPIDRIEKAAERGTAVHLLTELHDRNDLSSVHADLAIQYAGYLGAWQDFLNDYRPKFTGIEERVYHATYGYAGTADRFCVMDRIAGVLDVKTTSRIHNETGVQLAAYLEAANTQLPKRKQLTHRWVVQLREDGTYDFRQFDAEDDWPCFLGLLQLWHWHKARESTRNSRGASLSVTEHAQVLEWVATSITNKELESVRLG